MRCAKDYLLTVAGNFDFKREFIANPYGRRLVAVDSENHNSRHWSLWRSSDLLREAIIGISQINVRNGHHSEGDILRGRLVRTPDVVHFVSFRQNDVVMLQNDRVTVNAAGGLRVALLAGKGQI